MCVSDSDSGKIETKSARHGQFAGFHAVLNGDSLVSKQPNKAAIGPNSFDGDELDVWSPVSDFWNPVSDGGNAMGG